jgi:RsiW-degrading membrane proteinase PrsW (M82 family)
MALPHITTIGIAFLAGLLPALFWLRLWLKNDHHPEPRKFIFITFIIGALLVPVVIPLENFLLTFPFLAQYDIALIATIEETVKFFVVGLITLFSRYVEEPIDYGVYLITGALGFAALENTLFLINPIMDNNIVSAITIGNVRFLGATVVHAVSAAIIGVSMGTAFHQPRIIRLIMTLGGVIAGIALHAVFNFFIIKPGITNLIVTIAILWVFAVIIVAMFRRLGDIHLSHHHS